MQDEIRTQYLLNEMLRELKEINKNIEAFFKPKTVPSLVLRDDNYVKEILNISDTTLWRMKNSGILEGSDLGGRTYYTDDYLLGVLEKYRNAPGRKKPGKGNSGK